jgi:alpha-ketoglutarate-dependent taurine dioxygenase
MATVTGTSIADAVIMVLNGNVAAVHAVNALEPSNSADESRSALVAALGARVRMRPHNESADSVVWDIQARTEGRSDGYYSTFSESAGEAWYHTDSSYSPAPEEFFLLWCLRPAGCGGGQNLVVDGDTLAAELLAKEPGIVGALGQPLPFRVPDAFRMPSDPRYLWAPVLDDEGNWRYRNDTLVAGLSDTKVVAADQARAAGVALEAVQRALLRCHAHAVFLERGDALVLSNRRALHARTAFADRSRHLLRVRFDRH